MAWIYRALIAYAVLHLVYKQNLDISSNYMYLDISSNYIFVLGCGLARGAVLSVAGSKRSVVKCTWQCASWLLVGVERCRL